VKAGGKVLPGGSGSNPAWLWLVTPETRRKIWEKKMDIRHTAYMSDQRYVVFEDVGEEGGGLAVLLTEE